MGENNAHVPGGVLDTVTTKVKAYPWLEKMRESKGMLIDIGIYAGVGFLFGFLFKKYSKYLIALLVFVAALFALQQYDVITINVNAAKMNELFGLQPAAAGDTTLAILWEWIKANIVISISLSIGFLFGMRFG